MRVPSLSDDPAIVIIIRAWVVEERRLFPPFSSRSRSRSSEQAIENRKLRTRLKLRHHKCSRGQEGQGGLWEEGLQAPTDSYNSSRLEQSFRNQLTR